MAKLATKGKNFTEGPIFISLLAFIIPMILTGVLQALYNTADHFVVGKFSGDTLALAAIASTTSLTGFITNMLMGVAAGASVALSQAYGAREEDKVSRGVHTAMAFAIISGVVFAIISLVLSQPALVVMKTKPELMDKALLYMRIICLGMPFQATYNFGAAIMRSSGDSKSPLAILIITGIVNVVLNLLFVIVFHMSITGVAIATIIAHAVSAVSAIVILTRKQDCFRLRLGDCHIDKKLLGVILKFGIPTGLQSSLFSLSNIFLARGLNTLDTVYVSAKAVSSNVESISNTAINNFGNAMIAFVGQNYGAKKPERMMKGLMCALLQVTVIGIAVSGILLFFADPISRLFIDASDPNTEAIVERAIEIMRMIVGFIFLSGIMQTLSGAVRGMGYSTLSMIVTLSGACVLRILWVLFIFPLPGMNHATGLYAAFPITWVITSTMHLICFLILYKRFRKKLKSESKAEA